MDITVHRNRVSALKNRELRAAIFGDSERSGMKNGNDRVGLYYGRHATEFAATYSYKYEL